MFAHGVYFPGLRMKFVYEGHRVKVKVTGAKKVENSYSRDVKLRSGSVDHRAVKLACGIGFSTTAEQTV